MDAVVPCLDGDHAAADIHVPLGIVLAVFRVQAVRPGSQVQHSVCDPDGIVGLDGFGFGGDIVGAAGDFQVVLAHDAVIGRGNGEGCGSVQHQVGLGKNDAVGFRGAIGGERACHGQRAAAADGHKHFIGGFHIDHGEAVVGDAESIQHQLHLIILARLHIDGHIGRAPGQDVHPRAVDMNILPIGNGIGYRAGKIGGLFQVTGGKQVRRAVNRGSGFRLGVHGSKGEKQAQGQSQAQHVLEFLHFVTPSFLGYEHIINRQP